MEIYIEMVCPSQGMNLTIVSNLVMDTILGEDGVQTESVGGPPCYAGLTSKNLGFTINIVTRFGKNLKDEVLRHSQERWYYIGAFRHVEPTNY